MSTAGWTSALGLDRRAPGSKPTLHIEHEQVAVSFTEIPGEVGGVFLTPHCWGCCSVVMETVPALHRRPGVPAPPRAAPGGCAGSAQVCGGGRAWRDRKDGPRPGKQGSAPQLVRGRPAGEGAGARPGS